MILQTVLLLVVLHKTNWTKEVSVLFFPSKLYVCGMLVLLKHVYILIKKKEKKSMFTYFKLLLII